MRHKSNYEPTREQITNTRLLLDALMEVQENKRSFMIALTNAYMSGIEAGVMYAQDLQDV